VNAIWRYAVTVPPPGGSHAPPTVLVVHCVEEVGPGGGPVYQDASGEFRVEIDAGVARILSAPAGVARHGWLSADPLP
jgi:hypothetical protein